MTASSSTAFAPPRDDDYDDNNLELWLLRAPAHLDVRALLDGATINVDVRSLLDDNDEDDKTADASSSSSSSLRGAATKNKNKNNNDGNLLSRFAATSDGSVYALSLSGSCVHGSDGVRLLVDAKPSASPSSDDDEGGDGVDGVGRLTLVPHRPFRRHVQLSSVPTVVAVAPPPPDSAAATMADPMLSYYAPPPEMAPDPAVDGSGRNGSVDAVRRAYDPVPQRGGMRRRWVMPGGGDGRGVVAATAAAGGGEESAGGGARIGDGDDGEGGGGDEGESDGGTKKNKRRKKDEKEKKREKKEKSRRSEKESPIASELL